MSQIGSFAPNPHEGSRSEHLAQYIFSSFGTSIPVPHQEDSGIDLYCTLVERVGQRAWPRHYYAVQVKSTDEPWQFTAPESVRWFVQFPLPLFFCIVTKKEARLRVYHTSPRFYVWSLPPLPACVTAIPGEGTEGRHTRWEVGTSFSLSAPILDFTVTQALDDAFCEQIVKVLECWIRIDACNLYQIQAGLRQFSMPYSYVTNEVPLAEGTSTQGIARAEDPEVAAAIARLEDQLVWITVQLYRRGDVAGALRGLLLYRHLWPREHQISFAHVLQDLMHHAPATRNHYVWAGLDEIDRVLRERFPLTAPPPTT
jgi:hypothetical protein